MNIPDTLNALRDLAATPSHGPADDVDDLHEAEYLLATCEPPLAPAAYQRCMQLFLTLRDRATLREGIDRFGHCGQ